MRSVRERIQGWKVGSGYWVGRIENSSSNSKGEGDDVDVQKRSREIGGSIEQVR